MIHIHPFPFLKEVLSLRVCFTYTCMDHTASFVLFHFLGEIVMNPEDGVTFISGNTKSFTIPNNISLHELKEVIGS